jgi:Multiubiquitin
MNVKQNEVINIEEYAKQGNKPPSENVIYRFRVGTIFAEHDKPLISGREILQKVNLDPGQNRLYQKLQGGQRIAINLDETVDLSQPGLERFETIPLDPTEG